MSTKRYASDLTDEEWAILEPLIPPAKPGGRPRTIDMREVVNGIFYLLKTGCQWGMLPKDFPKWKTVNDYFLKWSKDGTWQKLNVPYGSRCAALLDGRRRRVQAVST